MATVKEIEAFLSAAVPAGLTDDVFEKIRELGLDSENSDDVKKALATITKVADVAAPIVQDDALKDEPAGESVAIEDFAKVMLPKLEAALSPIYNKLDELFRRSDSVEKRVSAVETPTPGVGGVPTAAGGGAVASPSTGTAG